MHQESLTLDRVLCDWVTLTGKEHFQIREAWSDFVQTREDYKRSEPDRWLQFKGERHTFGEGTVFTGAMSDKHDDWLTIRASGEISQDVIVFFYELVEMAVLKVTRIDVQITTKEPPGWGQINLCNRLYASGKGASFLGSTDGHSGKQLETVGVGSRKSDTYTRIYQKLTDASERLLRLEIEYKGDKARAVVAGMKETTFSQQLKYHLFAKLKDEKLTAIFANQLEGITPHNNRPKVKVRNQKRDWFINTILPTFEEYINDHSDDGEVAGAFLAVLEDFIAR